MPLTLSQAQTRVADQPFASGSLAFLNYLRFVALECRVKPRVDLFEACALLKVGPAASRDAYAEALMRCLPEALGTALRLHAPGTSELSFDERWLLQLGDACARGDADSIRFLLGSRVARENRRLMRFLIGQTVAFFPQAGAGAAR